jgi:hypothetical protein
MKCFGIKQKRERGFLTSTSIRYAKDAGASHVHHMGISKETAAVHRGYAFQKYDAISRRFFPEL